MKTVKELNNERAELQARMLQIETETVNAAESEKLSKIGEIDKLEFEAREFRKQAEVSSNAAEKRSLYAFAAENDVLAATLKKELGIFPQEDQRIIQELYTDNKVLVSRKINSLLINAIAAFSGYLVQEFVLTLFDNGFVYHLIKTLAGIFYFVAAGFGGFWVVLTVMKTFIPNYFIDEIEDDFNALTPFQKLILLAAIAGGMFILLNAVIPHAN